MITLQQMIAIYDRDPLKLQLMASFLVRRPVSRMILSTYVMSTQHNLQSLCV